jgi:hypothetical protein
MMQAYKVQIIFKLILKRANVEIFLDLKKIKLS